MTKPTSLTSHVSPCHRQDSACCRHLDWATFIYVEVTCRRTHHANAFAGDVVIALRDHDIQCLDHRVILIGIELTVGQVNRHAMSDMTSCLGSTLPSTFTEPVPWPAPEPSEHQPPYPRHRQSQCHHGLLFQYQHLANIIDDDLLVFTFQFEIRLDLLVIVLLQLIGIKDHVAITYFIVFQL